MNATGSSAVAAESALDGVLRHVDGQARLVASRCEACGALDFPAQRSCARCGARGVVEELLATEGVLWTWTVQTFPPKAPYRGGEDFAPFGVGYVELADQARIEARLTENRPERLRIGMPMRLTVIPLPGDTSDGLVTFAFAPIEEAT